MDLKVQADLNHFWVITVISNSPRFKRRYELYQKFEAMCLGAQVNLVTVELVLGQRPFMVTSATNPNHVQLRSVEELWHKENMVNLGISHARKLDSKIDKVAWIDCDIRPMRHPRDWFEETWQELQHYKFVQMYEEFMNLDSNSNPIGGISPSFMSSYFKNNFNGPNQKIKSPPTSFYSSGANKWFGPPGGAWAADISALNEIGMVPDKCIIGSGDWHLACALTESMNPKDPEITTSKYADYLFEIQNRCNRWIKKDVGVVRGGIFHDNHGPTVNRNYVGRKQILVEAQYDPNIDVKYDHQGLLQLETHSDRQIRLRDQIRAYFKSRNEDQIEIKNN